MLTGFLLLLVHLIIVALICGVIIWILDQTTLDPRIKQGVKILLAVAVLIFLIARLIPLLRA